MRFSKIEPGVCVVLSLHSPREKIWGILVSIDGAGAQIRGLDINTFDDWVNAVTGGEYNIGLAYSFVPMWRVERIQMDETIGEILSLEEQFGQRVGLSLMEYMGGGQEGLVS